MKTTTKVFNQTKDEDVLAYRIVSKFKMCLETDEWFGNSTENEKILAVFPPIGNEIDIAVSTLVAMEYNVKNENAYYGGPVSAIKYYPNEHK